MKSVILILVITTAVLSLDPNNCASKFNGFYCNEDGGYTLCIDDRGWKFDCAPGTACQCGVDKPCDQPCTVACSSDLNSAQQFCKDRMDKFDEQGYFCNPEGSGFYHCIQDPYCPDQPAVTSVLQHCPTGTQCVCNDTEKECSLLHTRSPCGFEDDHDDVPPSVCENVSFTCGGDLVPCGDCPGALCTTDASNNGRCAREGICDLLPICSSNSDCPDGTFCAINTCCESELGGVCVTECV